MALLERAHIMMEPYIAKEVYEVYSKFSQFYANFIMFPLFDLPVLPTLANLQVFTWFTAIYTIFYLPVIFLCFFLLYRALLARRNEKTFEKSFYLFQKSKENMKIVKNIRETVGEYVSPWWYNAHLGTIFAFGGDCNLKYHREIIVNEDDGGEFCLSWYPIKPTLKESCRKVVLYYPGLGLSSRSVVTQKFCMTMAQEGFIVVVVGARGVDSPLSTAKPWHPGYIDDSLCALRYIHSYFHTPSAPRSTLSVFLAGYSAGSNIALQTALFLDNRSSPAYGSHDVYPRIRGVFTLCVTYCYLSARQNLEGGVGVGLGGYIYSYLMAGVWKSILYNNAHVFGGDAGVGELVRGVHTLSQYDEKIGGSLHGIHTPEDWKARCSMRYLRDTDVPIMVVQPADDPLHMGKTRENMMPEELVGGNKSLIYMETPKGNHFGFYEGALVSAFSPLTSSYTYPPRIAATFFNSIEQVY